MILTSEISDVLIGEVICFYELRDGKRTGGVIADCVTELHFEWQNDRWELTEIWTDLYPECVGFSIVKPEQVEESIMTAAIPVHNVEVPERPPSFPGDCVKYNSGEGNFFGIIKKAILSVNEDSCYLKYDVEGQDESDEPIDDEWVIDRVAKNG